MPKGQQRGNKEAKKPKKNHTDTTAPSPITVMPVSKVGLTERPKKK